MLSCSVTRQALFARPSDEETHAAPGLGPAHVAPGGGGMQMQSLSRTATFRPGIPVATAVMQQPGSVTVGGGDKPLALALPVGKAWCLCSFASLSSYLSSYLIFLSHPLISSSYLLKASFD